MPVASSSWKRWDPIRPSPFLEKRGPGVHHVCLAVEDLEAALERAEAAGHVALEPRVRAGAGGHRVAFLHPKSTSGVLIELSEAPQRTP